MDQPTGSLSPPLDSKEVHMLIRTRRLEIDWAPGGLFLRLGR